jgi:Domain of unknown function (DUF929)
MAKPRTDRSKPSRAGILKQPPQRVRRSGTRVAVWVGIGVLVIISIMVAARSVLRPASRTVDDGPVPSAVLEEIESIPMSEAAAVGPGTARGRVAPIRAPVLRGPRGLPRVIYMGAEYCPFCAAQRWPLIVALSRFGRFDGLRYSRSAADDVFPNTPSFTFHGASYESAYVEFTPVELQTNVRAGGGGYAPLERPDTVEQQVFDRYNVPPYVTPQDSGSIPFIDVANQFAFTGASFSPDLLARRSWTDIAGQLSKPDSDLAPAVIGTANVLTAAICKATSDKPATVCGEPVMQMIERNLVSP